MRIAFFGNTCNNLYQIAKAIRAHSGFETHLYLDEQVDSQQLPESDDPELARGYPDWIKRGRYLGWQAAIAPWTSGLVRELNQYDCIILSGYGPMIGQFLERPWMFLVTGKDLTVWPFAVKYLSFYRSHLEKLDQAIRGYWQRRAIHRCREIWTQPFSPFIQALQALKVPESQISDRYFPRILDLECFRRRSEAHGSGLALIREIKTHFDFTVFCPSRMAMNASELFRRAGNWKANEILFTGFAQFLARCPDKRAGLVLVNRADSPDSHLARELIADLGLEKNVRWLGPFSRDQLVPLYSACDVVADEFGAGSIGDVVLEGLASTRPVLSYVDPAAMAQLYEWHPILSHRTPEAICDCLFNLWQNPQLRARQGEQGRRWVEQYHSPSASEVYVKRLEELCSRHVKLAQTVR